MGSLCRLRMAGSRPRSEARLDAGGRRWPSTFSQEICPRFSPLPISDGVCPHLVQRVPAWGRTAHRRVYERLIRFAIRSRLVCRKPRAAHGKADSGRKAGRASARARSFKVLILIKPVSCHSQNSRTARLASLLGRYCVSYSVRIRVPTGFLLGFVSSASHSVAARLATRLPARLPTGSYSPPYRLRLSRVSAAHYGFAVA